MKRRGFLAAIGLAPIAALAKPEPTPTHHPDGESYHDKYWQAQRHIDELEAELNKPSLTDKLRAAGFKPINRRGDLI